MSNKHDKQNETAIDAPSILDGSESLTKNHRGEDASHITERSSIDFVDLTDDQLAELKTVTDAEYYNRHPEKMPVDERGLISEPSTHDDGTPHKWTPGVITGGQTVRICTVCGKTEDTNGPAV